MAATSTVHIDSELLARLRERHPGKDDRSLIEDLARIDLGFEAIRDAQRRNSFDENEATEVSPPSVLRDASEAPPESATRRRNRTFQAGGCPALPVLKTGWATRPVPRRVRWYVRRVVRGGDDGTTSATGVTTAGTSAISAASATATDRGASRSGRRARPAESVLERALDRGVERVDAVERERLERAEPAARCR